jgi:hypothetical protein
VNTHHDAQPEPEQKDWTWVLSRPCPECGFYSREPDRSGLAPLAGAVGRQWVATLAAIAEPATRPAPATWSPLEYACHVRDVFRIAAYRVHLMLDEDDPLFDNWDQDATAIDDDYASQDPGQVGADLGTAAEQFAALLSDVAPEDWQRPGRRGGGASFTVESFTRYLLHDPVHHLTDITGQPWQ